MKTLWAIWGILTASGLMIGIIGKYMKTPTDRSKVIAITLMLVGMALCFSPIVVVAVYIISH